MLFTISAKCRITTKSSIRTRRSPRPPAAPATFVIVTVAEVLLAVAIIMGIWVRMSALILSLGILLMFAWGRFGAGELGFHWLGVVFLIIFRAADFTPSTHWR